MALERRHEEELGVELGVVGDDAEESAPVESVPGVFTDVVRPGCASATATNTPAVAASDATAVQAVAREIRTNPSSRWPTERTITDWQAAMKAARSKRLRIGKVRRTTNYRVRFTRR